MRPVDTDRLKCLIENNPPEVYRPIVRQEAVHLRVLSERMDIFSQNCDDPEAIPAALVAMLDDINK